MKEGCCILGRNGCDLNEKRDIFVEIKGKKVAAVPLECFMERVVKKVGGSVFIPGLEWFVKSDYGILELTEFKKNGGMAEDAIVIAAFFGGVVRKFLFPSRRGKTKYFGRLQGIYQMPQ